MVCTAERDAETDRDPYNVPGECMVAPNGTYDANLREHRSDSTAARMVREEYDIPNETPVCLSVRSGYRPNIEVARAAADAVASLAEREPPAHFSLSAESENRLTTGRMSRRPATSKVANGLSHTWMRPISH